MTKNKKVILSVVLMLVLIAAIALVWHFCSPANDTRAGDKEITVTVTHGDGSTKNFVISTDAQYLGDALDEQKLIEGEEGDFGIYIKSVDGETADDSNQEWWCLTQDGQMLTTGVDETPIADGDCFGLTLTVGYDF